MQLTEWIAAALGLATVGLVVTRSMWNYPFAIAMVSLYFFVFWDAKLYSDALLQIFFLAINLYGWANWLRSKHQAGEVLVGVMANGERALWLGVTGLASVAWGWVMMTYTDAAAPVWDALIAGGSVAAQILQARRRVECWLLWIAVDVIAIPLYWTRDLHATSALYVVFLLMSVVGLVGWWKAYRRRESVAA